MFISLIEDISSDVELLRDYGKNSKESNATLAVRLCNIVQLHADVKELSTIAIVFTI